MQFFYEALKAVLMAKFVDNDTVPIIDSNNFNVDDRFFYREKNGRKWSCHSPFFTQCYFLSLEEINLGVEKLMQYEQEHSRRMPELEAWVRQSGVSRGIALEWNLLNRPGSRKDLISKTLTGLRHVIASTGERHSLTSAPDLRGSGMSSIMSVSLASREQRDTEDDQSITQLCQNLQR
ncbi:MAG: hypothetical protein AAGM67_21295, partial [Bacteroidota bacterium]